LIIFRSFTLALNPNIILLAFAGLILSFCSWFVCETIFLSAPKKEIAADNALALERVIDANGSTYRRAETSALGNFTEPSAAMSLGSRKGMPGVFWDYADSFCYLFNYASTENLEFGNRLLVFAYFLFGGLGMVAIWSVAAGAITRIAVLRLARDEGCSLTDAVKFSLQRFLAYFSGPLLPMAFVLVLGLLIGLFCLLMRLDWGVVVISIFWFLILIAGFLMAFLVIGLLFGWPLMWPAISAESSDAFDSISRCYAYVLARPLHYLFYMFVSVVFGAICWWIVNLFGEQVISMSDWAASWGAGTERINSIHAVMDGPADTVGDEPSGSLQLGANIIYFWNGVLRTVVAGYAYGLFWCMASAVYLLLRRDVDETEIDEVFIEGEDDFGLPPLNTEPASSSRDTETSTDSAKKSAGNASEKKSEPSDSDSAD
jgi:hypothetical protein